MTYEKKISIIVPIFNSEKYIERCIKSLINQSYKNIEIIIVDDGSTDNSLNICLNYKKKDTRINVYTKKNGGTSSARNYGLKKSHGEYVGFIDSDDYAEPHMYEQLIKSIENCNKDIACCNKIKKYINGKENNEDHITQMSILNKKESHKFVMLHDSSVCNKLFKNDLFHNVKFKENNYFEDIEILPKLIENSNGMCIIPFNGYYYFNNEASKVNNNFNYKKMDFYYNTYNLKQFYNDKYPCLFMEYEYMFSMMCLSMINDIYPNKKTYKEELNIIRKELKKFKKTFLFNKYIPLYKKIMLILDIFKLDGIVYMVKKIMKRG